MSDEVDPAAEGEPEEAPADDDAPHAEWSDIPVNEPIHPVDPNIDPTGGAGDEAAAEDAPADDGE